MCFNEISSSLYFLLHLGNYFLTFTSNILLQGIFYSISHTVCIFCGWMEYFAEQTIIKSVHLPLLEFFSCHLDLLYYYDYDDLKFFNIYVCVCMCVVFCVGFYLDGQKKKRREIQLPAPDLILFWC